MPWVCADQTWGKKMAKMITKFCANIDTIHLGSFYVIALKRNDECEEKRTKYLSNFIHVWNPKIKRWTTVEWDRIASDGVKGIRLSKGGKVILPSRLATPIDFIILAIFIAIGAPTTYDLILYDTVNESNIPTTVVCMYECISAAYHCLVKSYH